MLNQSQKAESEQKQQLKARRPAKEIFRIRCREQQFYFFTIQKGTLHVSRDVVFIGLVQLMV